MAFFSSADDEVPINVNYEAESDVSDDGACMAELQELGVRAQRLAMARCVRNYTEGSAKAAVAIDERLTSEKMFHLPKLVEWVEGEPVELLESLRRGRLRCRLSAAMGMGKSTRLPSLIARELDIRVLYVTLDTVMLQQTIDYVHANGIGRFCRKWSPRRRNWLVGMTYADFNSSMASVRRVELFRSFELIIFDEAFMDSADVFVAKRCFAAYSLQETSLIACSATIKKSEGVVDAGASSKLGNFRQLNRTVSPEEAIASGKLCTEYLADRTLVLVATDQLVQAMVAHYEEAGLIVCGLDSASSSNDVDKVKDVLEGDAVTPRIVVAHCSFGIGLNLPVSQPLVFPYEEALLVVGDRVSSTLVPMTEEYVTQCKSRSGRGIVDGSGGTIFSKERAVATELKETEKTKAYVRLVAASIVPNKASGFWSSQESLFPQGLSHMVANALVAINLPHEVAIRYFGTDGRVAAKYCSAMNVFAQPNRFLQASDDEEPIGFEAWALEESIVGGSGRVLVPMGTFGEIQVVVQVIAALVSGSIKVKRWIPETGLSVDDGYDSNEERARRVKRVLPTLRLVEDKPLPPAPVQEFQTLPWQYNSTREMPRRSGGLIDGDRVKEAIATLTANVANYQLTGGFIDPEHVDGEDVIIHRGDGVVESPGGGEVCTLPFTICEKLNMGKVLRPDEMVTVIFSARKDVGRFVASKLFDNYSRPWDSILDTVLDNSVLEEVLKRGLSSDMYHIIDKMRGRFGFEVANTLSVSNVYKKKFIFIFERFPSVDKVMSAIKHGQFDGIAQTEGFIARVRELKVKIDTSLLNAERVGIYLPNHITRAQRSLPLRGRDVLGNVGTSVHPMPGKWKRQLEYHAQDDEYSVMSRSAERKLS